MTAQPQQTASAEEADSAQTQEEAKQTYDEKLANLYSDLSSQNQVTIQLIIGGAAAGFGYSREVIQAYNFLKKPLDPEKLITDPKYKAWVERATQLVRRHEGGGKLASGKSKYSEIIPKTQTALERVEATHSHLRSDKSVLLTNKSAYLAHIQTIYGFDEKQIKGLAAGAWERIKERPTLSMHEALRIEAESLSIRQVGREVDKDSKGKGLTKKQRGEEVQRRLGERRGKFEDMAGKWIRWEDETRGKPVIDQGLRQTADALGVELKPAETPVVSSTQPVTTTQVASLTSQSVPSPTKTSLPRTSSLKGGIINFLRNSAALQSVRIAMRKAIASSLIGLRKAGLRSVAKLGLALSKKAFPFLFKAGATALGATASLGTTLLIQAGVELAKKLPVIGGVAAEGEKIVFTSLKFVVIGILVVAIGIPIAFVILIGSSANVHPYYSSGDGALKVSLVKTTLGWSDFEKKYLSIKTEENSSRNFSWKQFEKENLISPGFSQALSDAEKKY